MNILEKPKFSMFLLFIFMIVVAIYGSIINQTIHHEAVHETIFDKYGVDSTVSYNWNPFSKVGGYTTPNSTQYYKNCNSDCRFLQYETEVFGYQLMGLLIGIWTMFLIWFFITEVRRFEDYHNII